MLTLVVVEMLPKAYSGPGGRGPTLGGRGGGA